MTNTFSSDDLTRRMFSAADLRNTDEIGFVERRPTPLSDEVLKRVRAGLERFRDDREAGA